mgnify:CR=1 FL=1
MGLQCDQRIRIPGTAPAAFRACKHSAAEGETKCARHGGRPMRPRRLRSWWGRFLQAFGVRHG